MITSKTNQQIKKVRKLLSSAKERKESGLFVIEGARLCAEAPLELVDSVFLSESCPIDASRYPHVERVEKGIFQDLSDTVSPQGILAVVRQPKWDLSQDANGKMLLLDGIRDPGNLGTIIRTAEAAGVTRILCSPDCVDLFNPKVIRSTMGSIFRVPVATQELTELIRRLRKSGKAVYGTSLEAKRSFREVDLSDAAIIIGSEANGMSAKVAALTTENIHIPMAGKVESLNAAVSAAILMFC